MFKFLLKLIFGRGLPLPLSWAFALPLLTGDVLVKDAAVGSPPVATVAQAVVDLRWSSLFREKLTMEHLTLRRVELPIGLEDPLQLFRCLQGRQCGSKVRCGKQSERAAGRRTVKRTEQPPATKKEPLKILIEQLTAEEGVIEVCRGENTVKMELERASARNISVPAEEEPLELSFNAAVASDNGKRYPLKGSIVWNPANRTLRATIEVDKLPFSTLAPLFPDRAFRSRSEALTIPFKLGDAVVVNEIRKDLEVKGEIAFSYDPSRQAAEQWEISLP